MRGYLLCQAQCSAASRGAISGGATNTVTGGTLTAAGSSVGSSSGALNTNVDTLNANASSGDVYVRDQGNVTLADVRSRLQAAGEKLVYVGMVRSQLVRGKGSSEPELTVFRSNDKGGSDQLNVAQDDSLQPGDVIEVRLTMDMVPGLPAH